MPKIFLVTTNQKRANKYKIFFQEHEINIDFEVIGEETPEIQSDDVIKVAEYSARWACEKYKAPVIKEDSAFEILALNLFPGPFVKYTNQWLKAEGYLKLMQGQSDRRAAWHNVLTYAEPGGFLVSFDSCVWGSIALNVSVTQVAEDNWQADRIWIPNDFTVPIVEIDEETRKERIFKRKKLLDFLEWYKINRI